MVELSAREALLLVLLLTCVPLQLWLNRSVPAGERDRRAVGLLRDAAKSVKKLTSLHYWETAITLWTLDKNMRDSIDTDVMEYARLSQAQVAGGQQDGECPAVEVLRHYKSQGFFGMTANQRRYRTPMVHYRVGQVVKVNADTKAVVVGWDETCQAPENVIERMYEQPHQLHLKETPHYTLLSDAPGRDGTILLYASQSDLQLLPDTKVRNPQTTMFFSAFDGTRYLLRPWMAAVYPED